MYSIRLSSSPHHPDLAISLCALEKCSLISLAFTQSTVTKSLFQVNHLENMSVPPQLSSASLLFVFIFKALPGLSLLHLLFLNHHQEVCCGMFVFEARPIFIKHKAEKIIRLHCLNHLCCACLKHFPKPSHFYWKKKNKHIWRRYLYFFPSYLPPASKYHESRFQLLYHPCYIFKQTFYAFFHITP